MINEAVAADTTFVILAFSHTVAGRSEELPSRRAGEQNAQPLTIESAYPNGSFEREYASARVLPRARYTLALPDADSRSSA